MHAYAILLLAAEKQGVSYHHSHYSKARVDFRFSKNSTISSQSILDSEIQITSQRNSVLV